MDTSGLTSLEKWFSDTAHCHTQSRSQLFLYKKSCKNEREIRHKSADHIAWSEWGEEK